MDLLVITSDFHVARARHLFNVAFGDAPRVEVLVLAVPNACDGATWKWKNVGNLVGYRVIYLGKWR